MNELLFKRPQFLYDIDDFGGSQEGFDGDDDSQDDPDGTIDLNQIYNIVQQQGKQLGDFQKIIGSWGNEIGETRKEISGIKDYFQNVQQKTEENEFDPYQPEHIGRMIDEKLQSLKSGDYVTRDSLMELLTESQKIGQIQDEFKLTKQEIAELNNESVESGQDLRLLAYDKYGERKWGKPQQNGGKNKLNLSKEFKNNDVTEPIGSKAGSEFTRLEIPSDPKEFDALVAKHGGGREGLNKVKELIKNQTRPAE